MTSLLEIIDEKLLPWVRDPEKQRLILMGIMPLKSESPEDVRFSKRLPIGPRKTINHGRIKHGSTATWPNDGLIERAGVPILICIFDGRVDYWAGDVVVHCGEGYFLLLPPGIRHDAGYTPHYDYNLDSPSPNDHCALLWIERKGNVINISTCYSQGAVHGSEPATSIRILNDAANQVLDFMMAEAISKAPGCQSICGEYLRTLFALMRRDLEQGAILSSSRSEGAEFPSQSSRDPIEQAISYIRGNLREPLTIDKVAHHVCLARTQFTRQFRQKTGVSFTDYLTTSRIEKAKTLLANTNWHHSHIGAAVGLRSGSYFCRCFVKNVGMSPRAYRQNAPGRPAVKHKRGHKADLSN